MGATFVAYACALMAFLYLKFTNPAYNQNGQFTPVVIAYAFLIGLQVRLHMAMLLFAQLTNPSDHQLLHCPVVEWH